MTYLENRSTYTLNVKFSVPINIVNLSRFVCICFCCYSKYISDKYCVSCSYTLVVYLCWSSMDEEKDKLLEEYYFNYGAFASPQKLFRVLNQKFPGRFSLGYIKMAQQSGSLFYSKTSASSIMERTLKELKLNVTKKLRNHRIVLK